MEDTIKEETNFKVFIILLTVLFTLFIILSFYLGAAYVCNQTEGKLDPLIKCHSKEEVQNITDSNKRYNQEGYTDLKFNLSLYNG